MGCHSLKVGKQLVSSLTCLRVDQGFRLVSLLVLGLLRFFLLQIRRENKS